MTEERPSDTKSSEPLPAPTIVRRRFKLHPAILWRVMREQAGTLPRAVLEGVMNAIDAQATAVTISCTGDRVVIEDDGTGLPDELAEIERCFETFGQPQEVYEREHKRFGTFRMGRGQLFAFGHNVWRSGHWRMDIDLKSQANEHERDEIDYGLGDMHVHAPGCRIEIDLYDPVLPTDIRNLEREIQEVVRYSDVPVTLNGKCISTDPATLEWDYATEDAYIRLRESGRLSVYNLGVHVQNLLDSKFGTGGVVVSRKQLHVNFARNEVLSSCPVWRRIAKVVDQRAKMKRRHEDLTDAERRSIAQAIVADTYDGGDAHTLKLLQDARGDWWSVQMLERVAVKHAIPAITVAARGTHQADVIMQYRLAIVIAQETLDLFGVDTIPEMVAVLQRQQCGHRLGQLQVKPFALLVRELPEVGRIVPETEWTPTERMMMALVERAQGPMTWYQSPRRRTLRLADSKSRDAWTDGSTYIALNRRLLAVSGHLRDWHAIGHTLLHEYCHGDSTVNTHVHGHEFYSAYHDAHARLGEFISQCVIEYPRALERANLVQKKELLRLHDRAAKAERQKTALAATQAETERQTAAGDGLYLPTSIVPATDAATAPAVPTPAPRRARGRRPAP